MSTGKDIFELAIKHQGERYYFGAEVPKNNANWKGPWDCAEFVSWCVYQTSGILYGCRNNNGNPSLANSDADAYTAFWGRDAHKTGKKISVNEAAGTKGAAVLRLPNSEKGGHIVISDGNGGTIEAHSPKRGVILSNLSGRRWDMGILVPGIIYETKKIETITLPDDSVYRLKEPMMSGEKIVEIQKALMKNGFNPGKIDGIFGYHTYSAVIAFQMDKGLNIDGEVGPITLKALIQE